MKQKTTSSATLVAPKRNPRRFLPENFQITDWESLRPYFEELLERQVDSIGELERWLADRSELDAVTQEDARWRFIKTTLDTTNPDYLGAFRVYVAEIEPMISTFSDKLDRFFLRSPYSQRLSGSDFYPYTRKLKNRIGLFCKDNIPLMTKQQILQKKYEEIISKMSVKVDDKVLTMQQASLELKNPDREMRRKVFLQLANRRLEDKLALDDLFMELVKIRTEIARNANYANFRDYQFAKLGRFDYTAEDCHEFHEAIRSEVVSLARRKDKRKRDNLQLDTIKPWDGNIDSTGGQPLAPFKNTEDMIEKSIEVFYRIDPYFGDCLTTMRNMKYLDLESRIGKAPGGYNCRLPEIGVPFIFMNATGSTRDVKVIMHEGGHAIHSFLSRDLKLTGFKELTSEIAELASMSMEFFSMDHWEIFYPDQKHLRRAKIEHLENIFGLFPWVATIDRFQHWCYTHPEHTIAEREEAWSTIHDSFSSGEVDWSGMEHYRVALWQTQLHIFKVPFYYVEYAIAQLGAIALWRNYKKDPQRTLKQYQEALSLGYTRTIGEIYKAAGIDFSFSRSYVRELMNFVQEQLDELYAQD